MHKHQQPVPWTEAALVTLGGFVLIGVAWGFLWLVDGDSGMLPYSVMVFLAQWFFTRHRFWGAAVAAGLVGTAVGFLLLAPLREQFGKPLADVLVIASALVSAMIVFTLRARPRKAQLTLPS
ncbi:hypothetical protein ABZX85_44115 [Streptomyces sp. NPDC004539]|uniref:hypothetical protein n=1 Tax=Streptomyces sp. NPDC004539 TaxID=3154280 RepID=UPI0033B972DB